MAIAVISDVHANVTALTAVLRDIRRRGINDVYCLGDCVGYSAFPGPTMALLRKENVKCIKGNHDMMATGELPIAQCGPHARAAMVWTRTILSDEDAHRLRALPSMRMIAPHMLMVHSRLDDVLGYLRSAADYEEQFQQIRARLPSITICFTGHTHKSRLVEVNGDGTAEVRQVTHARLTPECFYFINPGSVGHPRNSDYRSSYAVFDPARREVRWHRVAYDKATVYRENRRHDLHVDLGPGIVQHTLLRWTARRTAASG